MAASNTPLIASASFFVDTANAATAVVVKASSAVLYELELDNTSISAATYLRLYNSASPTVGTTVPDWIIMVPASTSRAIVMPAGITFSTALSCSSGLSAALATTTPPSPSSFIVRMVYV